ncbi:hypothetical protein EDD22DRAFT_924963 [Suillus occidentalis]|nr:hypothetical protein EDD22DRAFT_924963 [Suillus occidentalis]
MVMLSTLFVSLVPHHAKALFAYIHSTLVVTSSAIPGIPGITGGYRTSSSVELYLPFVLLFVFQLGLVSLTLIRAIQDWRSTRYPLHAALVKHNISYYACGLFFSALNVLVPVIFPDVFILAILATRMHLHLWHIDHQRCTFGNLNCISMPDMLPVHRCGSEVWTTRRLVWVVWRD